jgi:hypothetical protein
LSRVGYIYSAVVYVTRWPVSANVSFAAKHVVIACPTHPAATPHHPIVGLITALACGASGLQPGCFEAK